MKVGRKGIPEAAVNHASHWGSCSWDCNSTLWREKSAPHAKTTPALYPAELCVCVILQENLAEWHILHKFRARTIFATYNKEERNMSGDPSLRVSEVCLEAIAWQTVSLEGEGREETWSEGNTHTHKHKQEDKKTNWITTSHSTSQMLYPKTTMQNRSMRRLTYIRSKGSETRQELVLENTEEANPESWPPSSHSPCNNIHYKLEYLINAIHIQHFLIDVRFFLNVGAWGWWAG